MSFLTLLLLISAASVIQAVIYPGICPHKYHERQLVCQHFVNNSSYGAPLTQFIPVLHLPTDNKTINIFHNPFMNQSNCITFNLGCKTIDFEVMLNCGTHECESHSLSLFVESTYLIPAILNQNCTHLIEMFRVVIRWIQDIGTSNGYLLIWGCQNLIDSRRPQHEEGVWILRPKEMKVNVNVNQPVLLQKTMESLKHLGSSAKSKDFILLTEEALEQCQCKECPDKKRCDVCLKEIYFLRKKSRIHIFDRWPVERKHKKFLIIKSFGCDYGNFFDKITCFIHKILNILVT